MTEHNGSKFYIRRRVLGAEQRVEWQVCCGIIRGRCDSEESAKRLMAYLIREEPRSLAIKYEKLREKFVQGEEKMEPAPAEKACAPI